MKKNDCAKPSITTHGRVPVSQATWLSSVPVWAAVVIVPLSVMPPMSPPGLMVETTLSPSVFTPLSVTLPLNDLGDSVAETFVISGVVHLFALRAGAIERQ